MATRGTLRDMLRRRLNDTVGDQYSDSICNDYLNLAYHNLVSEIRISYPKAFRSIERIALTANEHYYPKPVGMSRVYEVAILQSDGVTYSPIEKRDYDVLRTIDAGSTTTTNSSTTYLYAHFGRFFYLSPAPSSALASGLQIACDGVPDLSDDSDVPLVHIDLHVAILVWAQYIAIGETHEDAGAVLTELDRYLAKIPMHYDEDGDTPDAMRPDINKGY